MYRGPHTTMINVSHSIQSTPLRIKVKIRASLQHRHEAWDMICYVTAEV